LASRRQVAALALCCAFVNVCKPVQQPAAVPPHAAPPVPADGETTSGVRLALLDPSANMHMARLEGVLAAEGPCLYVKPPEKGRSRSLPAFQIAAVGWNDRAQTLEVGGVTFRVGQRVVLGGGYAPNPAALQWRQRPDPSCDASNLFVAGSIEPG